jgi:hypothetical protein
LLASIVDFTPVFAPESGATRVDEIDAWLHENHFSGPFAILDDDAESFSGFLARRLVHVDDKTGLTMDHAMKCLHILKNQFVAKR